MSSGEARRVLLARALLTSPRALVLDEPTTGLDLVARHGFMERVREIARAGTTIVLITHHIEEIIPEIGRVVLIRGGGSPMVGVMLTDPVERLFSRVGVVDPAVTYANPGEITIDQNASRTTRSA